MQGSLRSLAVQLQPWPATLCVLSPAELVIPAARSIATWIGTSAAANAAASQPAEIRGGARYLCIQPHQAQQSPNSLPPSSLSSDSATSRKAPVAEAGLLPRRREVDGGQWRSHAGWSCQALAGVPSPAPPQPLAAARCSGFPCSVVGPGSRAARSRQRSRQRDGSACSRGLATEPGPQLLDSAGRPIVTGRRSADVKQWVGDAEERPNAQGQAAEARQDTAAASASGNDGQPEIAIDRSGLRSLPGHEHGERPHKGPETPLLRHLKALIRVRLGLIYQARLTVTGVSSDLRGQNMLCSVAVPRAPWRGNPAGMSLHADSATDSVLSLTTATCREGCYCSPGCATGLRPPSLISPGTLIAAVPDKTRPGSKLRRHSVFARVWLLLTCSAQGKNSSQLQFDPNPLL